MPKRFDQARPFLTLGLVVAAWLIIPTVFKLFTRASFFELTAPVGVAASYARDLQEYWTLRLHSNSELIEAGRDLARLNASYDLAVQQNIEMQGEIARLESILRLPPYTGYRSEHARVVRRDFSGWWQRLTIRKGKNFNLTVGAPVVFSGGVVGRISEVFAYTATVDLISSQTVRLAAVVEGGERDAARRPRRLASGVSSSRPAAPAVAGPGEGPEAGPGPPAAGPAAGRSGRPVSRRLLPAGPAPHPG
jgi:rod shape-determining protein MreC